MVDECCLNCAFHNPSVEYECEMTDDIPVVCSVKMKKMKNDKRSIKNFRLKF